MRKASAAAFTRERPAIVLALRHHQAEDWRREHGLGPMAVRFIDRPEKICGLRIAPAQVVKLDGWSHHPEALAIRDRLEVALMHAPPPPPETSHD